MNEKEIFEYLQNNLSIEIVDDGEGPCCGGDIGGTSGVKVKLLLKNPEGEEVVISQDRTDIWTYG